MERRKLLLGLHAMLLAGCATPQRDEKGATPLATADMHVPADDPQVSLFLHNKRRRASDRPRADRTVLFLHGLTYPGSSAFDLPLAGRSWMDDLATQGFDTWCMDVREFGRSTRSAAMDQPPQANPPLLDSATATRDVAAAVRAIQQHCGVERIVIVAWSWGTVLGARFAAAHPDAVERLVLYAPVWRWRSDLPVPKGPSGAYRSVTRDAALRQWLASVPAQAQRELIPPGWFEQWADATWATDPAGASHHPPVLRAPNGPLVEVLAHWQDDRPLFDPAAIVAPTLLVVGQWDGTTPPWMAQALEPLLVRAPAKRLVIVPEGTHQLFLERRRDDLFAAARQWLSA